MLPLNMQRKH